MSSIARSRRGFLAAAGAITAGGCIGDSDEDASITDTDENDAGSDSDAETDSNTDPEVGSVTLLLNWRINGLHAPYVAAKENGFYEDEGFDAVEIESGDGSDFAANQVGLGNVEFGISSSDQILGVNSRDLSPRSVGIVMQRNPNVLFADRNRFSELTDPEQLEGATIGSGPGMVRQMTLAYLDHHGIRDSVEYVDTGFDTVQQLLVGEIDAAGGVFGDVVDARHQGGEIDLLRIDAAIPSYGHLVATGENFAAENPETVHSFLRATARGAVWASSNPDGAIGHLVDVQPELDEVRENQFDKWEEMRTGYMLSDAVRNHGWGWNDSEPWERTHEILETADVLENEVDPSTVWTNEYLDEEYEYIADYADRTG